MNIYIDNRSNEELPLSRVEDLALFVLTGEGMPDTTELSVSFVTIDEITALNALYRDREEPTDVLSFEMDSPPENEVMDDGFCDTWASGEEILLGDIVINPDIARRNATLEEVTFEEELWILVIHGILHLVGFDHEDSDEQELMESKEDEYFFSWIELIDNLSHH